MSPHLLGRFWQRMDAVLAPLHDTWIWPGLVEVGRFLGTHLISGMVPAFFIAGAIAIFLDKQRITKLMGAHANPWVAYPAAAISGGILTVCSCGVLPIFAGIMHQGAGIGPAFTFLMAAPAVNLISLMYTHTLLGFNVALFRILFVALSAISIGWGMSLLFRYSSEPETGPAMVIVEEEQRDGKILVLFAILILITLTSTGLFDSLLRPVRTATSDTLYISQDGIRALDFLLAKGLILLTELLLLTTACYLWFPWEEIKLWMRKSASLFKLIFPKVILGIFLSGIISALLPLAKFMNTFAFDTNSIVGNLMASLIGAMMYFGTIVGVNIVSTLVHFGMHPGPALALLLAGPAVSLPSALALIPMIGLRKTAAFLILVVATSTISGLLFGMIF